ncbi:MAG: glutamate-cysteine ligase family protein [Bilophila sp.]
MATKPFGLFEVCGIEIEYMVVDRQTRNVRSLVESVLDQLVADNHGGEALVFAGEGGVPVEWSNELVAHVAEAKCHRPISEPAALLEALRAGVARVNAILAAQGAQLMPSAAHPWMNPKKDALLYPRDEEGIYKEYDRIFGCNTHGWTNLQSVHINLPFADAEEFGRLHAAIRVVLPLIPALAAASPYLDGGFTGLLDARMEYYRTNSLRIPSMTGELIPEPVFTPEAYQTEILERIYRETKPLDPTGILHDEWANARGAIARFDRNAIEIRVIDSQECPLADLALAHAVIQITRMLAEERFVSLAELKSWDTRRLYNIFFAGVRDADQALVDPQYAALFGFPPSAPESCGLASCAPTSRARTFRELWGYLFALPELRHPLFSPVYQHYVVHGPLARRLLNRYGLTPTHADLIAMVDALATCLQDDVLF